ncbi:MAG TPA: carboxypeptidase regulatory-like domain-containing protein [Gemmatimonadales bacterium]|jgi:hypothetical protein
MSPLQRSCRRLLCGTRSLLLLPWLALPLAGQSPSAGGLLATIVDERGTPVPQVTVSLEQNGGLVRSLVTARNGQVTFGILTPGSYAVLAEELGYQPVRMHDVPVQAGGTSQVRITIRRMPPPITAVADVPSNATMSIATVQGGGSDRNLRLFPRTTDISSAGRDFSDISVPDDGRPGYAIAANGLRPSWSSLVVDGVPEALLRHPGIPSEAATAPLFARDGLSDVSRTGFGASADDPSVLGSTLEGTSQRGTGKFTFRPWATYSGAKLGGRGADNPDDSAATSIQAGLAMGGAIKGDTAAWFVRGDYQQLELPSAAPFTLGSTMADSDANLLGAFASAAPAGSQHDINRWLAPTVRTWKGGSGSGRLDWRFGPNTLLAVRAGGASWTEQNPQVGTELVNGAGAELKAHDVSAAAALTTGSDGWTSETRLGGHSAARDWTGAPLPATLIAGDALAFGGAANLAGNFKEMGIDLSEAFSYRMGVHTLKVGGAVQHRTVNYDYIPGSAGLYTFGDLGTFTAMTGAFYQATRGAASPDIGVSDLAIFAEDQWQATPAFQIFAGVRFDHEALPTDVIAQDAAWERVSAFNNAAVPTDSKSQDFAPRGGFRWDAAGNGHTVLSGSVGLVPGQYDLAAFAEAAQFDGDVTVRRSTGVLAWPASGSTAGTDAGQALTTFAPNVHKPRSFKTDLSLAQVLANGTTLTVSGGYRHADYLLQRTDLNLVAGALATDADGRPLFGALEQYGALLTPTVGSNRRFPEFDHVYGLTSSGYNDHYQATLALDHHLNQSVSVQVAYTYSHTTDNLPGEMSADPANRLSPFPDGLNGARWEDGRSDFDIPHRLVATLALATPGKSAFNLAARFRMQSGLPFTPGFRPGVDANGDGAAGNDPAFVSPDTPGLATVIAANSCLSSQSGSFAARNSCRDAAVQALDLSAAVKLVHGLALTVDAYNVISTSTGLYDHALVLVDPHGTVTTDASGHTVLPLLANPGFGQLLSRRGDARIIRIGFRVEN